MSNDVQQRPAAWEGFTGGNWETNVDVRDFIQKNYTPYEAMPLSWHLQPKPQPNCGRTYWKVLK